MNSQDSFKSVLHEIGCMMNQAVPGSLRRVEPSVTLGSLKWRVWRSAYAQGYRTFCLTVRILELLLS